MEQEVFPAPAVAEELKNFVEVRMHYDHHVEEKKENANKLQIELINSIGAPMYVLMNPTTKKIVAEEQYTSVEGFLEFLGRGMAANMGE